LGAIAPGWSSRRHPQIFEPVLTKVDQARRYRQCAAGGTKQIGAAIPRW
jgi:hypothetical protein